MANNKIPIRLLFFGLFLITPKTTIASDITNLVFNRITDGMPAAFGDFNSDELTDVFVQRDSDKTIEILLAHEEEPLLRAANPPLRCTFKDAHITSVVPGDFDGDAFMDVMVTTVRTGVIDHKTKYPPTYVYIIWGGGNHLNCTKEWTIEMHGQPLALDYNQDMIIDLFGEDLDGHRTFWVFNNTRNPPEVIRMDMEHHDAPLRVPHAHACIGKCDLRFSLYLDTCVVFK